MLNYSKLKNDIQNAKRLQIIKRLFLRKFLLTLLLITSLNALSLAQTSGTTPSGLTTGAPAGSYSLTDFENVNLFSGNLNFSLPLLKINGRGSTGTSINLSRERQLIFHLIVCIGKSCERQPITAVAKKSGSVTADQVNAGSRLQSFTVVGTPTNAVVNIPAFTPGTFAPATATFTPINPALPVDYTLRAASTFHATNIRVQCLAPLIPASKEAVSGKSDKSGIRSK